MELKHRFIMYIYSLIITVVNTFKTLLTRFIIENKFYIISNGFELSKFFFFNVKGNIRTKIKNREQVKKGGKKIHIT